MTAPLTFEEIADRLLPAEPAISPDGSNVIFSVGPRSKKEDKPKRTLWLSRNGKPAKPFSGGEWNDHDPRWSPDGERIAFLSNRKDGEKDGLYLISIDGGEAQRLGEIDGSLANPQWSPDGKQIAFLRTDPDTDDDKKRKEDKDDPITVEIDLKVQRLWVIDVETGKARCLTFGTRNVWDFGWSLDGQTLVYITTPINTINSLFGPGTIWTIPASGGLSRKVAEQTPMPSSPVVRELKGEPIVAVIASRLREDPANAVWTVPLSGGDLTCILPNYKGTVEEIRANPADPESLVAKIVEGTHARAYTLATNGKKLKSFGLEVEGGRGTIHAGPSLSTDGKQQSFIWSASDRPEEVFVNAKKGGPKAISELGKAFKDRLAPGEVVQWTGDDGVQIEGILVRPLGYEEGKKYPLVVQIHGGPSWQWEDRANFNWHDWAQMLATRGYATLLPNPRGSTGYGAEFEKLLIDDVGGGESRDLVTGAQAMVERGLADPERLAIAGWSWGGYLTAWTITQTDIFKAAIMGAGLANLMSDHAAGDIPDANNAYYSGPPYTHWELYADRSPIRHVTNVKTPTLILHGDADDRVSPTQGMEYYVALRTLGIPVEFIRYPREGHGIAERAHQLDLMKRIVDWLQKYVD